MFCIHLQRFPRIYPTPTPLDMPEPKEMTEQTTVYPPGHARAEENDRADRLAGKATSPKRFASQKLRSDEELETLSVGTTPKTLQQASPGAQRHRQRGTKTKTSQQPSLGAERYRQRGTKTKFVSQPSTGNERQH